MEKHYLFNDYSGGATYLFENKKELDRFFKKYIERYVEGGRYGLPEKYEDYNFEEIDFITAEDAIKDYGD